MGYFTNPQLRKTVVETSAYYAHILSLLKPNGIWNYICMKVTRYNNKT